MRVRDLNAIKGIDMTETLYYIKSSFKHLKEVSKKYAFQINDWLYDHMEYPDSLTGYIKDVKPLTMDISCMSTTVSTKTK